jgi:hypothetical protein
MFSKKLEQIIAHYFFVFSALLLYFGLLYF